MIAGTVKAFNLPLEYVLYRMSYANMILYGAVLPGCKGGGKNQTDERINADDPRNRDRVRRIFNDE